MFDRTKKINEIVRRMFIRKEPIKPADYEEVDYEEEPEPLGNEHLQSKRICCMFDNVSK